MGAVSKSPEIPAGQCGLWLYFSKGKTPVLQRAFFRAHPDDLVGNLERGKRSLAGVRWDKSIKAFCLLCVHYVISANSAEYNFSDDPRKKKSGPDAAESLSEVLNRRDGWPKQLFQSKTPGIRKQLFRTTNRDGIPEKPFTRIVINNKWLPPTAVRVFSAGDALTMETDAALLWGLLSALRQQSKDFKSLRGTLAGMDSSTEENKLLAKPHNEKTGNDANTNVPVKALQPEQSNKPITELFKSLPVASIISHITVAHLPARGEDAIDKFHADFLSPDCLCAVAEKIIDGSINEFCDFFYAQFEPPFSALPPCPDKFNPLKIKNLRYGGRQRPNLKSSVAAVIASNKDLRAKLAAKVARCGFWDMISWFQAFSFFCVREIVVEVEYALNAAAEEPGFKEKFLLYAPEQLPTLIKWFSDYSCVVAVRLFEKINDEGRENETKLNKLLYG